MMGPKVEVIKSVHKNLDHGLASPFMMDYLTPPQDVSVKEATFSLELDIPLLANAAQTRHEKVEINYKVASRPDSKKWMLLVNGFGSTMKLWDFQYAYLLRNGYNLVLFDLLGQGGSSKPSDVRYSLDCQVKVVEKLVEVTPLSEAPYYLTGISAGGIIAQAFALKNNNQAGIKALSLLSTTPKVDASLAYTQEVQRVFLSNDKLSDTEKVSFCAYYLMDHIFTDMFFRECKGVVDAAIKNNIGNNTVGTYLGALCSIDDFDVVAQLGKIKVPTYIFSGMYDKTIEPHFSIMLNEGIPHSRRYLMTGPYASHSFILEIFESFNEVFVKELAHLDHFQGSKIPTHVECQDHKADVIHDAFALQI
jgi:pimeloyl-ACP methyl ester carboxylesterase